MNNIDVKELNIALDYSFTISSILREIRVANSRNNLDDLRTNKTQLFLYLDTFIRVLAASGVFNSGEIYLLNHLEIYIPEDIK